MFRLCRRQRADPFFDKVEDLAAAFIRSFRHRTSQRTGSFVLLFAQDLFQVPDLRFGETRKDGASVGEQPF